ncbi:MAG: LysM peptidoglycan-binding domain-containing protein [Actinomycetota bacterium]
MTGRPASPLVASRRLIGLTRAIAVPLILGIVLSAGAANMVRVKQGDTLSSIAKRYHTTVAALRQLNDIPGNSFIFAGQSLRVPAGAIDSAKPRAASRVPRYHRVVAGDTLVELAAQYRTSVSWLQAANKLPRSRIIRLGDRLLVGFETAAPATSHSARIHVPAAVPRSRVKELIKAEAKRAHIDQHLALALAWQESGFQMDIVSRAGAVGAMQVMPDTGRWMSANIVGRPLDLSDVEDNVIAGVRFLAVLLRITGKTPAALAGYYQGLASVKNNGQYADTKAYVRNVLSLQRRFRRG